MTANKSTFTFILKEGEDCEFQLEPFYLNTKSQEVEPLSASPRSTPRDHKKPFGAINQIVKIDEEIIKIENKDNDSVYLEVSRLAPLIDKDDSRLKSTLIDLKDKPTLELVNSLNQLITKFNSEECQKIKLKHQKTVPSSSILSEDYDENLGEKKTNCTAKKLSVRYSVDGSSYGSGASRRSKRIRDGMKDSDDGKRKKLEETKTEEMENGSDDAGKNETGEDEHGDYEPDILAYAEKIIGAARYKAINSDDLQVPACLKINQEKVEDLKQLLTSTPDKTQTWCGGVVVYDNFDKPLGPVWIFVNQEIFVAMKELECEGRVDTNKVPVVLHIVKEDDAIELETFGLFLNTNSKSFSEKLHDQLLYQDILRFTCSAIVNEGKDNAEELTKFLKRTLRGLPKGSQNVTTFIKFASLPVSFLNQFEAFLRMYETGGLNGQNISSRKIRNMDKKSQRKKICKLEIPLHLLKLHLKVSQSTLATLLPQLLSRTIELGEYTRKLKDASNISDVKREIEKISKTTFEEVKKKAPEKFGDQTLRDYCGAKQNASGQNQKHEKLVEHVNANINPDTPRAVAHIEQFLVSDSLNIHSLSRIFKDFNIIILNCRGGQMKNHEFCLTEQVKDSKSTIGIIIREEESLREDIYATFSDNTDIVVVYIYIKVDKPAVVNGVRYEISPIVVFGHKDNFRNKELRNFHNFGLQQSLQFVLCDLVSSKERVLYSFDTMVNGIDIDIMGVMKRKGVLISYIAEEEVLCEFKERVSSRVK